MSISKIELPEGQFFTCQVNGKDFFARRIDTLYTLIFQSIADEYRAIGKSIEEYNSSFLNNVVGAAPTTNRPKPSFSDEEFLSILGINYVNELSRFMTQPIEILASNRVSDLLIHKDIADLYDIIAILMKRFQNTYECYEWLRKSQPKWLGSSALRMILSGGAEGVKRYLLQATDPRGDVFSG
jgi:hypothetical protein